MPEQNDIRRVDLQRVLVFLTKSNCIDYIFHAVLKPKLPLASPGAPVVKINDIPPMRPYDLCEVQIPLVTRIAV